MAIRLNKPWQALPQALNLLRGQLGVYELADDNGDVIFIGFAGGKSQFGLRSEVAKSVAQLPQASQLRYEVTTAYHTRYRELLMVHQADFGTLPRANQPINLGKLSPA